MENAPHASRSERLVKLSGTPPRAQADNLRSPGENSLDYVQRGMVYLWSTITINICSNIASMFLFLVCLLQNYDCHCLVSWLLPLTTTFAIIPFLDFLWYCSQHPDHTYVQIFRRSLVLFFLRPAVLACWGLGPLGFGALAWLPLPTLNPKTLNPKPLNPKP